MRLATWNLEWASPDSHKGRRIAAVLDGLSEVTVATEADLDLLPPGHALGGGTDWGYQPKRKGSRKVALWSTSPWHDVEDFRDVDLPPGRIVAGWTETTIGSLRVVGLCIPWMEAHVRTGRRNRSQWEEHESFLRALPSILARQPRPLVVAGDFNQRIPRTRQPHRVADLLTEALTGMEIVTSGDTPLGRLIDHVAISRDLRGSIDRLLPSSDDEGPLSDHVGVVTELTQAPS